MRYTIVWKKPFKDPVHWLRIDPETREHMMLRNGDHVTKFSNREEVNRALLALYSSSSTWQVDGNWPHIVEVK